MTAPRTHSALRRMLGPALLVLLAAARPGALAGQTARLLDEAVVRASGAAARQAEAALARGRGDSLRAAWDTRLRSDPADSLTLLALATLDRLAYRHEEALARYRVLLPDHGGLAGPVAVLAELGRARTLSQMWRTSEADEAFERAAAAAGGMGAPWLEATALIDLAPIRARSVGVRDALAVLDRAEVMIPPVDSALVAAYLCTRGMVLVRVGDTLAVTLADRGRALGRALENPRIQAACAMVRAQDLARQGRARTAFDWLERVAVLSRESANWSALAAAIQWRAFLFTTYGMYGYALDDYADAIAHAERSNNRSVLAWAWMGLGDVALRLDEPATAIAYFGKARPIFEDSEDQWGRSMLLSLEADAANGSESGAGARRSYEAALDGTMSGNPALAVTLLRRLGGLDLREGRVDEAEQRFSEAHALAVRLGMASGAGLNRAYDLGQLELARGSYEDAAGYLGEYLERVPKTGFTQQIVFDARARLAEALARGGDLEGAARELVAITDSLDAWRALLEDRRLRLSVLQGRRADFDPDLGIAFVIASLAEAGQLDVSFRLAERFRARHLLERVALRTSLSSDVEGADPGAADSAATPSPVPEPVDLPTLQAAVPRGTAVIYFVTGVGDPTTVFTITRHTAAVTTLPPGGWDGHDVTRLVALLESRAGGEALAVRLGDALLRPALAGLPDDIGHLMFVPDGALHRLPFDVLPHEGGVVLDRFATGVAPSASYLASAWTDTPLPPGKGVLALGDPRFEAASAEGMAAVGPTRMALLAPELIADASALPRLAGSGREAREAARFSRVSELLLGEDASEPGLAANAGSRWAVIHIATHALVAERSLLNTALVLSSGPEEDGFVYPEELVSLKLGADLVVLSGCRTAGGSVLFGEGVQGLTAPLLEAEVRAVVASYWPLDDRRTVALMRGFYRAMSEGNSAVEALRTAKLHARRDGASPAVWAALTLVGDPEVVPALEAPAFRWGPWVVGMLLLTGFLYGARYRARAGVRKPTRPGSAARTHQA